MLLFILSLLCLLSLPDAAEQDATTISRRLQFENMMELPIRVVRRNISSSSQQTTDKDTATRVRRNISTTEKDVTVRRRLQFEGMMEMQSARGGRRKKGGGGSAGGASGKNRRKNRPQALTEAVEEISNNADRYSQWWTGPLSEQTYSFTPAAWGAQHNPRWVSCHVLHVLHVQFTRFSNTPHNFTLLSSYQLTLMHSLLTCPSNLNWLLRFSAAHLSHGNPLQPQQPRHLHHLRDPRGCRSVHMQQPE